MLLITGLVIANWDTIKDWTAKAWNAVVGFVTGAWDWISGVVASGVDKVALR